MSVFAVCSLKGSPGATTLALALAAVSADQGRTTLVVEADPAGGDLAARVGLAFDPGLLSLAASARHSDTPVDVAGHSQPLPCGGAVVVCPSGQDQAGRAVAGLAHRLPGALRDLDVAVIDAGRWTEDSPAAPALERCDLTFVVTKPDLAGVEHLRANREQLDATTAGRLMIVLVGDRPYSALEVEAATGLRSAGAVAVDAAGAAGLLGASRSATALKAPLVRSVRSLMDLVERASREAVDA